MCKKLTTIWTCVTFLIRLFTIKVASFFERWSEPRSLESKAINPVFGNNNSYWRNIFVSRRMSCSSRCFVEPLLCICFENRQLWIHSVTGRSVTTLRRDLLSWGNRVRYFAIRMLHVHAQGFNDFQHFRSGSTKF